MPPKTNTSASSQHRSVCKLEECLDITVKYLQRGCTFMSEDSIGTRKNAKPSGENVLDVLTLLSLLQNQILGTGISFASKDI